MDDISRLVFALAFGAEPTDLRASTCLLDQRRSFTPVRRGFGPFLADVDVSAELNNVQLSSGGGHTAAGNGWLQNCVGR